MGPSGRSESREEPPRDWQQGRTAMPVPSERFHLGTAVGQRKRRSAPGMARAGASPFGPAREGDRQVAFALAPDREKEHSGSGARKRHHQPMSLPETNDESVGHHPADYPETEEKSSFESVKGPLQFRFEGGHDGIPFAGWLASHSPFNQACLMMLASDQASRSTRRIASRTSGMVRSAGVTDDQELVGEADDPGDLGEEGVVVAVGDLDPAAADADGELGGDAVEGRAEGIVGEPAGVKARDGVIPGAGWSPWRGGGLGGGRRRR